MVGSCDRVLNRKVDADPAHRRRGIADAQEARVPPLL